MPEAKDSNDDFRNKAVRESQRLLDDIAKTMGNATSDPVDSGTSYCLPSGLDARPIQKRIARAMILGLVFGFGGLLAGALIVSKDKGGPNHTNWPILILGMSCTLSGFASLFGALFYASGVVGRVIRQRLVELGAALPKSAIPIEIENADTIAVMKSIPDDSGFVIPHPDLGFLQIEGLTHRYVVWAEDVVGIQSVLSKYQEQIFLTYKIGGAVLKLVIKPRGLGPAFKRQTIGGSSSLEAKIRECLRVQ